MNFNKKITKRLIINGLEVSAILVRSFYKNIKIKRKLFIVVCFFFLNFGMIIVFFENQIIAMKKNYLIFIFTVLLFSSYSQTFKVDYDNSSKWFLGLNVGAAWNTTDVTNKTDAGWGIILGKSYGYNFYSPLTFDIRARYLRGFWYGQDTDTSSVSEISGQALSGYTNQGFTVHNFQSDVHRLGLELAIHLNSITSRTGWDPYIFGGIGLTWHQTYSDLLKATDSTSGSVYDYSSMLGNLSSVEDELDGVYDTPLDGYKSDSYNVAFMPSLGFGLGYNIGKRISLGIEHKTTFTLRDDFDGLVSTVRPKNDLYHYTSLYLRFRFRGKQPTENISDIPCNPPSISITQSVSDITVTNPEFQIEAKLINISNSNQISLMNNIGQSIPFNFNSRTGKLLANVALVPGENSFTIRVNNGCGTDSKVIRPTLLNCSLPSAVIINPTSSNATVKSPAFTLTAVVTGVTSIQGIKLMQNNVLLNGYSFNPNSGVLQASVNLAPGKNIFNLELFNACGNNTVFSEVNYDNCTEPTITLFSPSSTGTTVNTSQFNLSALISGVTDKSQVVISQNNISNNTFTLTNGAVNLNTILNPGINTFIISASTRCGTASQTVTVNYQTCNAPIITLVSPQANSTVTTSNQLIKTSVVNVDSRENLLVTLNGLALKNINFVKNINSLEFPVNLTNGVNSITITATNTCGADVETIIITYNPCIAPKITLSPMLSTVNNTAYFYSASIENHSTNQGISLTLNGNPINYSYSNNLVSTNVNLQNGVNTFILSVSKECGTDTKIWSVTNNNCINPSIILESPTVSGITVNSASFNFKSSVIGMSSTQGIQFSVNGSPYSFTYTNGIITSTLNLVSGSNIIKIVVQNACGNDSEELILNYQNCESPKILLNQPSNNNFTTNQGVLLLNASLSNIEGNQGITVKLNGVGIPFQLNSNTLSSAVTLLPGANTILISVSNSCGTDLKAINVNYDNCTLPQISISNNVSTTTAQNLIFTASIMGSNLSQGISFLHNGIAKPYTLNGSVFSSNIVLTEGLNTFILSAVNSCGNDSKTYSVNYTPCLSPTVSILNPASNNLIFNAGNFTFQAQVSHVSSSNQISITHNGQAINNFSLANNQVVSAINLVEGNNTIKITVSTSCGSEFKIINITGRACNSPTVIINSSTNSTSNSSYNLQASITNVSTPQGINISINGVAHSNFTYSNGNLSSALTLINGINTIIISVNNECGNASKTHNVTLSEPCNAPSISFVNLPPSGSSINANSIQLSAQIDNYNANTNVVVKINGNITSNYQNVNGLISGNINLPAVPILIEITASNECGTDTETYSISKCKAASISLISPNSNNFTTTNSSENLIFNVFNVSNMNQIQITNNGQIVSNISFNGSQVQTVLQLTQGLNIITVSINNNCNLINELINITYNQPSGNSSGNSGSSINNSNGQNSNNNGNSSGNSGSSINNSNGQNSNSNGNNQGGGNGNQNQPNKKPSVNKPAENKTKPEGNKPKTEQKPGVKNETPKNSPNKPVVPKEIKKGGN